MKTTAAAGALAALVAGGLMAALAASGGGLAAGFVAIVALTVSLVIAATTYGWLVDSGRIHYGLGPGIVFWSIAFPVARLAQEMMVSGGSGEAGPSEGIAAFLVYQAMVGGAFGLGFVLLHSQIAALLGRAASRRTPQSGGGAAG